jgi:hypothetical protein
MALLNWIDETKLQATLSANPNAIRYLEQHPEKIDWYNLSGNPEAIHILSANPDKINFQMLAKNVKGMQLLSDKTEFRNSLASMALNLELQKNPAAIDLFIQNPQRINWVLISLNPAAIPLIEQNLDKISWVLLSYNPAAIHILEANQDKIHCRGYRKTQLQSIC